MSCPKLSLDKLIKVHYGKALKAEERIASGSCPVYGSNGLVGYHSAILVDYPTIVVGRKGSVGAVTYAPEGGWTIDTAFYIEIINSANLDLRYLYYALKQAKLDKHTITTSIPGLNRDDIYNTKIPLPLLGEQRRIAAILDKADVIRRKRQESIRLTEEFLRSTFLEMFGDPETNPKGWGVDPLEKLVNFTTGKLDSNAAVPGGSYPFFTCAREDYQIDTYAFDCEALLLAGNNASADYSVKHYKGKFNAYQRTYVITLARTDLTYRYMQYALEMKLQDMKRLSKGTNTKYLTLGILNQLQFQVPDKALQIKFELIKNSVTSHMMKQNESLALSNKTFESCVNRAFRGEL